MKFLQNIREFTPSLKALALYHRYKNFTMIPKVVFIDNLLLCLKAKNIHGAVVECGVWKGGMSAAIAELLGNKKKYYLFDSFEGLPDAKEIDGENAIEWQKNKGGSAYFDNCKAKIEFAQKAMKLSGAEDYDIVKGWFKDTLKDFSKDERIAILRIDGDWYESTTECLEYLYDKVEKNGIIILDDYYAWNGCAQAIHAFLSRNNIPDKIRQTQNGVAYIIKS